VKFQLHLQLARVFQVYGPELDALEHLSFHCVWHGLRLLQPDCEVVHVFRMWVRDQHFVFNRLCLEKLEALARVNLLDVFEHLPFVFGAFLGMRQATPSACACGSLSRVRLHAAELRAVRDPADVGDDRSEVSSDSGGSDSSSPHALVSDRGSVGPPPLGVASLDGGSEWGDAGESGSDSVPLEWFVAFGDGGWGDGLADVACGRVDAGIDFNVPLPLCGSSASSGSAGLGSEGESGGSGRRQ
jgi:hypothetical protein